MTTSICTALAGCELTLPTPANFGAPGLGTAGIFFAIDKVAVKGVFGMRGIAFLVEEFCANWFHFRKKAWVKSAPPQRACMAMGPRLSCMPRTQFAASPSICSSRGLSPQPSWAQPQTQVLRYQAWGSRVSGADSGPRLWALRSHVDRIRPGLGVGHIDIEVAVVIENTAVLKFVLVRFAAAALIFFQ